MKIFYIRNKKGIPVACVASEISGDRIHFAVSTHNPMDKYSKKVSRDVAIGRLMSNVDTDYALLPKDSGISAKASILQRIVEDNWTNNRAKTHAKRWLKKNAESNTKPARAAVKAVPKDEVLKVNVTAN